MIVSQIFNHNHALRKHHPVVKSTFVMLCLMLNLIAKCTIFHMVSIVLFILAVGIVTNIPLKNLAKIYSVPLVFIFIGVITIAIEIRWQNSIPQIRFPQPDLQKAFALFLRSCAMVSILYFWLLTNTISEIIRFFSFIKVPTLFTEIFLATYKYIFFSMALMSNLYKSQNMRLAYVKRKNAYKNLSWLFQSVFIQSLEMAKKNIYAVSLRSGNEKLQFLSFEQKSIRSSLLQHAPFLVFYFTIFFALNGLNYFNS